MSGILDKFRKKLVPSVWKTEIPEDGPIEVDDKIALGVLMQVVAESDEKFLPEENQKIEEVLKDYCGISDNEIHLVMAAVREAAAERIDLHRFTREVSEDLPYGVKRPIVENLFRVACADGDLAHEEAEAIRKISGLMGLDHKDFIEAKIKIKKEFGIETID